MRRFTALIAALAVSVATPLAMSAGLGFMSNTPLSRLKPADVDSLHQAVLQALDQSKDGEATSWTSSDTGSNATTVAISPLRTFKSGGMDCRSVQLSFTSKVQKDGMTPSYCKGTEGTWALKPAGKKQHKASSAE